MTNKSKKHYWIYWGIILILLQIIFGLSELYGTESFTQKNILLSVPIYIIIGFLFSYFGTKATAYWVKGLLFGVFMVTSDLINPLILSEVTISSLLTSLVIWAIGGLGFGYIMKASTNQKEDAAAY